MSTEPFSRGVRPEWVDDKLFPFTSRFVELSGNVVHYVAGAGHYLQSDAPTEFADAVRTWCNGGLENVK